MYYKLYWNFQRGTCLDYDHSMTIDKQQCFLIDSYFDVCHTGPLYNTSCALLQDNHYHFYFLEDYNPLFCPVSHVLALHIHLLVLCLHQVWSLYSSYLKVMSRISKRNLVRALLLHFLLSNLLLEPFYIVLSRVILFVKRAFVVCLRTTTFVWDNMSAVL